MKTVKIVLFLMILTTVCTSLLAVGNYFYQKKAAGLDLKLLETILEMYEIDSQEGNIEKVFLENFDIKDIGDTTYYIAKGEVETGSAVFKNNGPGLWSNIEILLSVKADKKELFKMRIVSHGETPGLGARIEEPEFLQQFEDIQIRPELKVVKFSSKPNEVDGISGATNTSNFLQIIINEGIAKMDQALREVE